MIEDLVSIIVPTSNSSRFLERCLQSVSKQTYSDVETIVVDNYSTDETRKIAERYCSKVVLCKGRRSEARNVGAGFANGEFLLSIDSDMELTSGVVSESVALAKSNSDAVIIPEFSIGEGFWASCRSLEKECYIGDNSVEAARFFKKRVFDVVGGYDDLLVFGEDWDLNQRTRMAHFKIGRVNALILHHEGALSLRKAVVKKYDYSKTLKYYASKHPNEASKQLNLMRPAFLRNWRKLAKDPVHTSGMFFMKFCEFAAGAIGVLSYKQTRQMC
jgi:glycosyltransferase involved in cell wall biosynthesis